MFKIEFPLSKRSKLWIAVGLLIAVSAAAYGYYRHRSGRADHFLVVTPGVLYRSGQLTPDRLEAVLKHYGIRTVVNLRSPGSEDPPDWHLREAAVCNRQGVRLVDLPMDDDRSPDADQITAWLEIFRSPDGLPVLVHCKNGVVRTGMMVALYEIEYLGRDPRRVLEELPTFGHDLGSAEHQFFRDLILGYTPRRASASPPAHQHPARFEPILTGAGRRAPPRRGKVSTACPPRAG